MNSITSQRKKLFKNQISATESVISTTYSTKNSRRRLILRNGTCNIDQYRKSHGTNLFQFSKLVNSSWIFILSSFFVFLSISWFIFGVIWWLICFSHGDFEPDHLPPFQKRNNFKPCVYEMYNFASCLLFSWETHHTVGYGIRATTNECPEAIFVNVLQCIIGFVTQGLMAVIIFAKITLPKLRSETLLFSKNAVICCKNQKLWFMFQIGDMRKNHLTDVNIKAFFVQSKRTLEGLTLEYHQTEMVLQTDGCKSSVFFNWPLVISHEINRESPLYNLSPTYLLRTRFEIVVVLEGCIQSTGQTIQARTSYLPDQIIWGYEFQELLSFNEKARQYEADFSRFNCFEPVSTPWFSASELDAVSDDSSKLKLGQEKLTEEERADNSGRKEARLPLPLNYRDETENQ